MLSSHVVLGEEAIIEAVLIKVASGSRAVSLDSVPISLKINIEYRHDAVSHHLSMSPFAFGL